VRRWASAALGLAFVGAVLGVGCSHAGVFHCESNGECHDGAREGVCTDAGYCAFDDESCASGLAYGELAEAGLAGACVPVDGGTGTSGGESAGSSSSSTGGAVDTGDETGFQIDCPDGVGAPCEPLDPCAVGGTCNAEGTCVPTAIVTCNAPPGSCQAPQGECLPDGGCAYPLRPAASECDDGDPCTVDDLCDDAGTCVPGPVCPYDDPCQPGMCMAEGCVYGPSTDGSTCGATAAARCCNGACVDISSDPAHCGGCDTPCIGGQGCESVASTPQCDISPANTSGRCGCDGTDDCPLGQICRTDSPYAGRCTPEVDANCDGVSVDVDFCPNYCGY
jgi:hypothetical protein